MDRRQFFLAGAATALNGTGALAQMKMDSTASPMAPAHALALPQGAPLQSLSRLANRSAEPGLFEASLAAEPSSIEFVKGRATPILGFNGMSPGPLVEATEGDRVRINFANRIPGQDSTIHWHGMPVPADQDGNPMDPVASGATRTYEFVLPMGSAGTYWYHPHPHGKAAEQVYRGLAGAFVVKPQSDPISSAYGDTLLFLTDLRLSADGTLPPSTTTDMMNGRVGDHVLVNGQKNPKLSVPTGSYQRFRLINATNARFLRLSFGNAPMIVIGSDGGLLEAPVHGIKDVILVPAERIDLIVAFEKPGTFNLRTLGYDRGWMGPGRRTDASFTLLTFEVSGAAVEPRPVLPASLRAIAELGTPTARHRFVFGEDMTMAGKGMDMRFMINGQTFDMTRVDTASKTGEVELWEIANPTDMDHPFHVHGTQFQVIETERAGKVTKPNYRAWKDTINVARGDTIRLLIRQNRPGLRMYHCHILEHEDLGMMGVVDVRA
jgi:bilirubin oxidase